MVEVLQSFKKLKLSEIEMDSNQPRQDLGTAGDKNQLKKSIRRNGLQRPLMVLERKGKHYLLIDGHRRYQCLKDLGISSAACLIYDQHHAGDLELIRYESQNNMRKWRPLERADAFVRIKKILKMDDRETARRLGISEARIRQYLDLRDQKLRLTARMAEMKLNDSFQLEFIKLHDKLTKVGKYEVDEIREIIFKKINSRTINNAKDLRGIRKSFENLDYNTQAIINFLENTTQTVNELRRNSLLNNFLKSVERVTQEISLRSEKDIPYMTNEETAINKLKEILDNFSYAKN